MRNCGKQTRRRGGERAHPVAVRTGDASEREGRRALLQVTARGFRVLMPREPGELRRLAGPRVKLASRPRAQAPRRYAVRAMTLEAEPRLLRRST